MRKAQQVVIGFIGSKGAGKDTVADIAIKKFKARKKVSFARPFKDLIMKNIIGFTDYQIDDPKGKDEVLKSNLILNHRNVRKIVHVVANEYCKIKKDLRALNPYSIPVSQWENKKFVMGEHTYRDVMRYVSTEIIRTICPTWHVDMALSKVANEGTTFICDLRFANEFEMTKKKFDKNFYLVYIKNDKAEKKNKDSHISEQEYKKLIPLSFYTVNSVYGDLDGLEGELKGLMKKIKEDRKIKS